MAHFAAFQPLSSVSCFTRQSRLSSSAFVRFKLIALPVLPHIQVIRCHVEDWSPKELLQFRKKQAHKKLRKIRKENKAKRRAEERAQTAPVKPNPAMHRFERPLRDWNKPWKKKKVSVAKNKIEEPHQDLGFKQGNRWIRDPQAEASSFKLEANLEHPESLWREFEAIYQEKMKKAADASVGSGDRFQTVNTATITAVQHLKIDRFRNARLLERKDSGETPESSNIGTREWSGSAPSVDGKNSVLARLRGEDTDATSNPRDNPDTLRNDRFDRELARIKFESSTESTESIKEDRIAGKASARKVPQIVIGRRKGEDVYLSIADDDATIAKELPRSDLDEDKQLEWLAKQLDSVARPDGVHLSRVIRSGGLKITDGRSVCLVQKLGNLGNWRCALQVVDWLNRRNQFPAVRSRYLYTTLLAVLGKARRPIESLNVFNAMKGDVATYPDMPAYRIIAVTLGQAGHLEELFELTQTLRKGPDRSGKYLLMVDQGRLFPDIVVYNAALNACVSRRHWRLALRILDQIHNEKDVQPNSASYGLAIEVMVKAGKFDLAWKILGKMELGGFHPNSLTYKVLVEGLGQVGKADLAVQMVLQMEERGIVPVPGVYCALASTLCACGKWQDALLQVDRIAALSERPLVETYTGLIKACKESGRWSDAVSVFEHMREVCAPNLGTCNIMISVYGVNKMYDEAKNLFEQIKKGRISPRKLYWGDPRLSPDGFTYDAILGACTTAEEWKDLEVIFRQMVLQGYQLNSKRHAWILQAISEAGQDDLLAAMFSHLRSLCAASVQLYVLMIKSSLSGGEQDNAFNLLEEMRSRNMRISPSDYEILGGAVSLLSEEDRLIFMNKVEGLRSTCDFNFAKDGRLSGLPEGSSTFKQQRKRQSPWNIRYGSRDRMSDKESTHTSLQMTSASFALGSLRDKSFDTSLSPVDLVITKDRPSEEFKEGLVKFQSLPDDSHSTLMSAGIPGWEFLWKRSTHRQLSPGKFQLT